MGESAVSGAGAAPSGMPPGRPGILPYQHRDERQGWDRVSIQDTGPRRVDLGEAARQLQLAAHDAQVAFDCMGLGELDRAHTHAITARAAADAAENLLRAALADGAADQG
jgi:hypothetical protein